MPDLETIAERARDALLLKSGGREDLWLWEHTVRVMRLARHLCGVEELAEDPPDETAALLATGFAFTGWAREVASGKLHPALVLHRPTNEYQRETAVKDLPELAGELVSAEVIQLAQEAIRQSHDRFTGTPEAQVLAEAESLADMGMPYVLRQMRRYTVEGRTLADFLASWNRQHEYHFWDARINDGLRFEESRRIARLRLDDARECVSKLERQVTDADL